MQPNHTARSNNLECDVVVVGGGGSGLCAAVAAGELGARVLVLEKRPKTGGNSAMATGFFAADSPVQRRSLIDARNDDLFKTAMAYAHWTINPRIVRAYVDKSGDTVRWLEDKGVHVDEVLRFFPNQTPAVWHCLKRGGVPIIEALVSDCSKLGIPILCDTTVKKITTDEAGKVTGVLVESEGRDLVVAASRGVIASGGFAGNKDMLRKYCSFYGEDVQNAGLPHNGDGIRMAFDLGAGSEALGHVLLAAPRFFGSRCLAGLVHEPGVVLVNKRGQRFVDEAVAVNHFESAWAIIRQPERACYALIDESAKRYYVENGFGTIYGIENMSAETIAGMDKDLRSQSEAEKVKIAETWDEIAAWIGARPEALRASVEEYNVCCDEGYDPVFAKDRRYLRALRTPPYYAIKCVVSFTCTLGGIKINHRMEVLDRNDYPIAGLYAVGSDAGGWGPETYDALLTGSAFGWALNSGRIAGENAAQSLPLE